MTTTTAPGSESSTCAAVLHLAMELSRRKWKLAFSTGLGQKARERNIDGGDGEAVLDEIERAKERFGLPANARVVSCYEAGPEGFWLHHFLCAHGSENFVVDSSSIEVNRKRRRAKTDKLDVRALLRLLIRHILGEEKVWRVVHVPDAAAEDRRQLHRERATLTEDRTRIRNRIRGLLQTQGVEVRKGWGWKQLGERLKEQRLWDGRALGARLMERLARELDRLKVLDEQMATIRRAMAAELKAVAEENGPVAMMQRLMQLRSIGVQISRVLVMELFSWRDFQNRKQVGGCVGFDATPYDSGATHHEQGISKAGNVWVRRVLSQLAWSWVRLQPESALTKWFMERFATGGRRQRARGIVALARKLLIALWRYVRGGQAPVGAIVGKEEVYVLRAA
jgi:transposase